MDYRMHTPPSIRCNDGLSMYPRAGAVTLTLRTNRPSAPGSIAVNFIGDTYQSATVRLFFFPDLRLVMQHRVKQRTMDLYLSVVADEASFPKPVHEKADARSGGADHIGQYFLTERHRDGLRAFFAEIRQ